MAKEQIRSYAADEDADRFAERCIAALQAVYGIVAAQAAEKADSALQTAISYVLGMASAAICAKQAPGTALCSESAGRASAAVEDGDPQAAADYKEAIRALQACTGLEIFAHCRSFVHHPAVFAAAASALRSARSESPVKPIYYEAMPLSWLSTAYQRMLACRPSPDGPGLQSDFTHRKRHGVYFTPPSLVSYIVESALRPLLCGDTTQPLILDPAMGGGDFLAAAVEMLADMGVSSPHRCVRGVDIDTNAVEIARFRVWAASGYLDDIGPDLNIQLRGADVLSDSSSARWRSEFPEVFENGGFDAVVGNPPYLASKNGLKHASNARGQSDAYLAFLSSVLGGAVVKPGGTVSMVLPDPILVRENAAQVRRKMVTDWTLLSVLHISGSFRDAGVANAVVVLRNAQGSSQEFLASRIERAADRRDFALRPLDTAAESGRSVHVGTVLAQKRCELLYLLEDGEFAATMRRIHGEKLSLDRFNPPFAPLGELNVSAIYRGEEIGKAAIVGEFGELPILLGGQSIKPYQVTWEGYHIDSTRVRKPLDRYMRTKLLLQKSSPRLIAALDRVTAKHQGYVFPQSVYAIELTPPGIDELYLLCVLNSRVIDEYIWRTATAYKMVQPQIEIEDVRRLPIRRISFITGPADRDAAVGLGLELFEKESLRAGTGVPFEELSDFARRCLTQYPEQSDVVHDVLCHLGEILIEAVAADSTAPSPENTRRIETTRAAVETVVERLYTCLPVQPAMPL